MKKGQVTIFIIVAILVIILIFLFFMVRPNILGPKTDFDPVSNHITSCIDSVTLDGIYDLGLSGGYYEIPDPKINYFSADVPLYWNLGEDYLPSLEMIESELMDYIKNNLNPCIQDFSIEGFEINTAEVVGKAIIKQDFIDIKLDSVISVKKGEDTVEFKHLTQSIDFDLYGKYKFVEQIIQEQKNSPNSFPLGFITNLGYENDFIYETISVEEGVIILALIFEKDAYDQRSFIYAFANKYDWSEE